MSLHMSSRTGVFGDHQPCCTCREGPEQSGRDSLCRSNKDQTPDSQTFVYHCAKMLKFYENVFSWVSSIISAYSNGSCGVQLTANVSTDTLINISWH